MSSIPYNDIYILLITIRHIDSYKFVSYLLTGELNVDIYDKFYITKSMYQHSCRKVYEFSWA